MATADDRKRYRVTYYLDRYTGETATWHCRAYDRDHVLEKFCDQDGWDETDILSIAVI